MLRRTTTSRASFTGIACTTESWEMAVRNSRARSIGIHLYASVTCTRQPMRQPRSSILSYRFLHEHMQSKVVQIPMGLCVLLSQGTYTRVAMFALLLPYSGSTLFQNAR
ncbi:hypothetical protein AcV7_007554 [Taiwanofungus camphoratus]|nr:hypothetical protein AcV7_007554 [Antrodia cinnamomea]